MGFWHSSSSFENATGKVHPKPSMDLSLLGVHTFSIKLSLFFLCAGQNAFLEFALSPASNENLKNQSLNASLKISTSPLPFQNLPGAEPHLVATATCGADPCCAVDVIYQRRLSKKTNTQFPSATSTSHSSAVLLHDSYVLLPSSLQQLRKEGLQEGRTEDQVPGELPCIF